MSSNPCLRAVSTARGPGVGRGANRNTKNAVDRWYNHLLIFILTLLLHLLAILFTNCALLDLTSLRRSWYVQLIPKLAAGLRDVLTRPYELHRNTKYDTLQVHMVIP